MLNQSEYRSPRFAAINCTNLFPLGIYSDIYQNLSYFSHPMHFRFYALLVVFLPSLLWSQNDLLRYKEEVFSTFTKTTNILFSSNDPIPRYDFFLYLLSGYRIVSNESASNLTTTSLRYNLYQPTGDTIQKRPAIVLCFGGGFVAGEKEYWSMNLLAEGLAKRGFVVAAIDYRLGMYITDSIYSARAVYRGVQDSYAAISHLRANATNLRIDPDQVFIGGHSAGAFVAIHNLYMDDDPVERPIGTYAYGNAPNQGGLLATSEHPGFNGRANGGFALAGAIGNPTYINSGDKGIALFHSSDDPTVNIGYEVPFKEYENFGLKLPKTYGSDLIEDRFQSLNIPYQYDRYTNRGHDVHENGTTALHSDILPKISSWLMGNHLKPTTIPFEGGFEVCSSSPTAFYQSQNSGMYRHHWSVIGGTIISGQGSPIVEINWDTLVTNHSLSYTPITYNHAAGDSLALDINVANSFYNTWTSTTSGSWDEPGRWSKGRIPLGCDEVSFDANITIPQSVTIGENQQVVLKSLSLPENYEVIISSGATLRLKP